MSDREAIQEVINRYSEGSSRPDWDMIRDTFAEDGVWAVPVHNIELKGWAAMQPAMAGFVEGMAYFIQINSPATIAVDGDRATARSIIRECGKFKGRDEALEVMGIYEDELVRTAQGWKFARRTFRDLGAHRIALQPGPALG